ncbi:MarR family winged helix-turn-helix transcriptional regulator [Planctomicrobium sp. SH668]|uniref:MarR family winged helix-turn-helix transcriptional regulator n=1 Tax=Planctomicrobium sp. SH668 TaxID=3448126 RepID=UPI003F5C9F46
MKRLLADRYATEDLSSSKAAVLQALMNADQRFTQADLATELSLSESSLCSLVDQMHSEGLLIRGRSTVDRRKSVLNLTELGRQRCLAIEQIHSDFAHELLIRLSDEVRPLVPQVVFALGAALQSQLLADNTVKSDWRAA